MSKLLADPKVAALVEKAAKNATKAETKRVLQIVKEHADTNKEVEDKVAKKTVDLVLKSLVITIKQPG